MMSLGVRELAILLVGLIPLLRVLRRNGLPLPPGPSRIPLIGNALSIPKDYTHKFYRDLSNKLGSKIIYLEAFGQPIVVLNEVQLGQELLERRSSIYSSRPHMAMLLDVVNIDYFFSFLPYGDIWRRDRRLFTQYFSPKTLGRDRTKIVDFVRKALLPGIYQSPHDFRSHIKSCIGGFFIAVTYGVQIHRVNDPMIRLSEEVFTAVTEAVAPGRFLVDVFPVLRHVPCWIPGARFKTLARKWRAIIAQMSNNSFEATVNAMHDGIVRESFVSDNLARQSESPDTEASINDIKRVGQQVYGAGFETTSVAFITFILVMVMRPDVQKMAQRELDSVLGSDRLPDFADQSKLPYLSAVLKEVLRWNPIVPLGVPHSTIEEDVYQGYRIPKGSMVLANAYAMLYDENIFPEPHIFRPERFLKDGALSPDMIIDPETMVTFGFGRRICPGLHLVMPILYMSAASILSLFDILPELDANGSPIEVVPQFTSASLVSEPLPFPCRFVPRQGKPVESLLKDYLHFDKI